MATTEVSICNSALMKIGAGRILALTDASTQAQLANEQYAKLRDSLLMEHPWKFAVGRKQLGLSVYVPQWEYDKAFQLPPDLLRILDTDLTESPSIGENPWDTEIDPDTQLRYLLCNEETVKIKYIKRVGEAFFTPLFSEVLAWRCAMEWAYPLTQNASLAGLFDNKYKEQVRLARSFSAMEASVKVVEADDWFLARHSSGFPTVL